MSEPPTRTNAAPDDDRDGAAADELETVQLHQALAALGDDAPAPRDSFAQRRTLVEPTTARGARALVGAENVGRLDAPAAFEVDASLDEPPTLGTIELSASALASVRPPPAPDAAAFEVTHTGPLLYAALAPEAPAAAFERTVPFAASSAAPEPPPAASEPLAAPPAWEAFVRGPAPAPTTASTAGEAALAVDERSAQLLAVDADDEPSEAALADALAELASAVAALDDLLAHVDGPA